MNSDVKGIADGGHGAAGAAGAGLGANAGYGAAGADLGANAGHGAAGAGLGANAGHGAARAGLGANAGHGAARAGLALASGAADASRRPPSFGAILWSFLKLAPLSFGGGYAIFPALEKEMVAGRQWMDGRTLAETLSLAAAAPGGVGVNAAFLIGYRLKGVPGAIAAGLGAIVPTSAAALALFLLYQRTGDTAKVRAALAGVTWGIATLILFAAFRIGRTAVRDKFTAGLMLAALVCLLAGLPPVYLIVGGTAIGLAAGWTKDRRRGAEPPASQPAGRTVGADSSYMYYI